jgi:hypothetical protein
MAKSKEEDGKEKQFWHNYSWGGPPHLYGQLVSGHDLGFGLSIMITTHSFVRSCGVGSCVPGVMRAQSG